MASDLRQMWTAADLGWRCEPAPAGIREFHAKLPGYVPTPLVDAPELAASLGVGRVLVKDESARLGLPAFKALGASWAVHLLLTGRPAGTALTLVTATDGNHGRAVARTARLFGQRAVVYVPEGVHPAAVAAIGDEGATVVAVPGPYDEAVRRAAAHPGGTLVQDTAWPGYERVPGWIVDGYSTLFAELDDRLPTAPDLVVVPAGVGSLAQAAVTHYRSGSARPALLTVEPETAACVLASLTAGEPVTVPTGETALAGLNCGTVSSLAWPLLRDGLSAAVAVTDEETAAAAQALAAAGVPAGPCGAASLAGARAALPALDLPPSATIVLLSTEGREANPSSITKQALGMILPNRFR
ncbi:pyridoxal-phosphate dependent enzyme [Actinocorallia longicatena]|uniref:Tryptophan synthase beta chain-like PALP domain-containing protein n=1 Tax=Actinocorallia longicatena TaxID=111803 RepID=A0ABP6QCA2_9ACTN